ncbi:MAG TPA: leucine--tRNA ligase [Candidatus Paceibacterota bacterium]|nr:leucine--tRNA ligase [Candidatus Paceibacterota bacterium]
MADVNFKAIEEKWQKKWEEKKIFRVRDGNEKKYYILEMFPYPSGDGLHMGHAFNYIIGDIFSRFKKMQGYNVLHPMGYDSLGLPAENAAIKAGVHPKEYTEKAILNYIKQQKELGISYDWTRMVKTHDPEYYKWDQWIFLKMFEKGLAFRKKAPVNWCSKCHTVLANEQVHNGKCWRHEDINVEIKHLEQWFFKTTEYANELYEKIDTLENWPERVKAMQKNWIGKSYGTEINFEINGENWPIFTTRPDTIYGVTFMVVSAQHPKLMELVTYEQKHEVEEFLSKIKSTSEKDIEELEKEGAFTGSYAINPVTGEKIPVYTGNFVIADYGCGMVMAVPAHDQRDFEFAKKYNIQIKVVIQPDAFEINAEKMSRAYTADGRLVNSEEFNGWSNREAIDAITEHFEKIGIGKKVVNFKLRDWLISRQRYWGTPIPIVYCEKCGIVPIPENKLPVKLPENVKFGEGNPILSAQNWIKTKCPQCGGKAKRETDTMDTFVNSSWYFLRYCDAKNKKQIFDKHKVKYWMPLDKYIGGAEHACMHLIYFRFYTKFLRDIGYLEFDEPTYNLFNQGMVHGNDGAVMSKSRGNVVLPEEVSKKYGIDTARLFLMSIASPDKDTQWSDSGVEGSFKFTKNVIEVVPNLKIGKSSKRIQSKINKTIKEVTEDIENFKYNLSIIKIRQLFEAIEQDTNISKKDLESFLKLLAPFCPHIAEELWEKIKGKKLISISKWPVADESKIDFKMEEAEKAAEKVIDDILNILRIIKEKSGTNPEKVYLYVMPNEISNYNLEVLNRRTGKIVTVFAVNDKAKYDPEGKSSKAKPGKPGIFVE